MSGDRRIYKGVSPGDAFLSDRRSNPRPLARGDSRVKSLIGKLKIFVPSINRVLVISRQKQITVFPF